MKNKFNKLTNLAYDESYIKKRLEKSNDLFIPKYLKDENEIIISKEMGYKIYTEKYEINREEGHPKYPYTEKGSKNKILDKNNSCIYEYIELNCPYNLYDIIKHSNGKNYLCFKTDFYGYSFLDLSTLKDFHYTPHGINERKESFIWCSTFYNPENDIIAVEGCFWSAPYDVLLYEIKDPLKPFTKQLSVHFEYDNDYERFHHIDFKGWNGSDLQIEERDAETEETNILILKEDEYLPKMKKDDIII